MRRVHIALAVANLETSITDYSARLGVDPEVVIPGKYAMWRTDGLNLSVNQLDGDRADTPANPLRHLGFEDPAADGFSSDIDVNGIEWEIFSPAAQDEAIRTVYGQGDAQ